MARISRALAALACLLSLLVPGGASAAPGIGDKWFAPPLSEGRAFPVLRSASGHWLNWRDTFGAPRMRLVGGVWKQVGVHQGIDIFAEEGAPIVSVTPGRVERVGWTFYSGRRVGVRGNDGKYYFYAHMSSFAPGLAEGQPVAAGQTLGRVGNSGYGEEGTEDEFPPHLHIGVQNTSEWENPQALLVSLYASYVAHSRSEAKRVAAIRSEIRLLRSRVWSPGAPPLDLIASRIAALESERARILENTAAN